MLGAVDMMDLTDDPRSIENPDRPVKRQRSGPDRHRYAGGPQRPSGTGTLPAEDLKKLGWLDVRDPAADGDAPALGCCPSRWWTSVSGWDALACRTSNRCRTAASDAGASSLTPTGFGEEVTWGPMDAVFAVASGMLRTYADPEQRSAA